MPYACVPTMRQHPIASFTSGGRYDRSWEAIAIVTAIDIACCTTIKSLPIAHTVYVYIRTLLSTS